MKGPAALAAALLLCAAPAFAQSLRVEGNRILYGERPVILQGVAVGDPLIARRDRGADDYAVIAHDWNANAVRISVHPSTWRDFGRIEVTRRLKEEIGAAEKNGLFVILVWHAIGIPDGYYEPAPPGLPADAYDTNLSLAEDFWRHMAAAFGRDGRVIFEIWNEPLFADHPPPEAPSRWEQIRPYWRRLIALIRANGGGNLILASGRRWSSILKDIRKDPLTDPDTAYSWHIYPDSLRQNRWEAALDGLDALKPVVVSEWGFEPDGVGGHQGTAESFGIPFRDAMLKGHRLSYTAWCWHPFWTPRMLEPDWRTPTAYGRFVKETLWQRQAGELVRPHP